MKLLACCDAQDGRSYRKVKRKTLLEFSFLVLFFPSRLLSQSVFFCILIGGVEGYCCTRSSQSYSLKVQRVIAAPDQANHTHWRCRGLLLHLIKLIIHTLGRTPLSERPDCRRDLYLTHNNTAGIRIRSPIKRAAVHSRLRPRGHRDQHGRSDGQNIVT